MLQGGASFRVLLGMEGASLVKDIIAILICEHEVICMPQKHIQNSIVPLQRIWAL